MDIIIDLGLLVMVIISLSELFKKIGIVDTKYIPAVNLALGLMTGVVYLDGDIKTNLLMGVIIGLTASGLFDMTKVFDDNKY